MILEKGDMEKVKTQLYKKGEKFFRTQAKLVKVFGKYYYKRMTAEEHAAKLHKFCVFKDDIKGEKQLADYMAKEQCIRDPFD